MRTGRQECEGVSCSNPTKCWQSCFSTVSCQTVNSLSCVLQLSQQVMSELLLKTQLCTGAYAKAKAEHFAWCVQWLIQTQRRALCQTQTHGVCLCFDKATALNSWTNPPNGILLMLHVQQSLEPFDTE